MPYRQVARALLCCLGSLAQPVGAQDAPSQPLFARDEPLHLTLATDLRALLRDRGEEPDEYPATLRWTTPAGDTGSVDVELRTRGIFRLKRCAFPPLRLDVPRSRVDGTPFAGQDKLKIVTHCRDGQLYEQNLLHEYALYRIFNVLTDRSFRARLARVTYVDTVRADTTTRYAFLIEADEAVARRLGAEVLENPTVHDLLIEAEHMTLVAVFQYLIGNTDWSVWGRHNIAITRDPAGTLLAFPYDFDFAGVISAPYATPAPQLNIRSVRERVYRGFCQPDSLLQSVLARFRAARESIYAAVRAVPDLEEREVRQTLEYFDRFYRTIDGPDAVRREFVRRCRRLPQ
ncbi:MAG: hypothetical protein ACREME_07605 [Gemmatimonadales bacterium]